MLNKLELREAEYTDGMNAWQPWNDVNVINITFQDRRCIDEPAFQTPPPSLYVYKLQGIHVC